jgi:hypothetical protein
MRMQPRTVERSAQRVAMWFSRPYDSRDLIYTNSAASRLGRAVNSRPLSARSSSLWLWETRSCVFVLWQRAAIVRFAAPLRTRESPLLRCPVLGFGSLVPDAMNSSYDAPLSEHRAAVKERWVVLPKSVRQFGSCSVVEPDQTVSSCQEIVCLCPVSVRSADTPGLEHFTGTSH